VLAFSDRGSVASRLSCEWRQTYFASREIEGDKLCSKVEDCALLY